MSLFVFTKSDKSPAERTPEKRFRNKIYITCGIIMLSAIMAIALHAFAGFVSEEFYLKNHLTFWLEVIALEAFGISWLIKGEALFADNKH